jgi:hypothetical protein
MAKKNYFFLQFCLIMTSLGGTVNVRFGDFFPARGCVLFVLSLITLLHILVPQQCLSATDFKLWTQKVVKNRS